jgi:hypothetical protein
VVQLVNSISYPWAHDAATERIIDDAARKRSEEKDGEKALFLYSRLFVGNEALVGAGMRGQRAESAEDDQLQ